MNVEIKEMSEEDIANLMLEHEIKSRVAGFESAEEMDNFKVDASLGMIKFGGTFTHFLGHALARADSNNTVKILRAFREDCTHHAELYKKWNADRFKEGIKDGEKLMDLGDTNA